MYSRQNTLISSDPETLKFVCRICNRPDEVANDEEYRRAQEVLHNLGVNFPLPTVCRVCDREMHTPRNRQGPEGEIVKYAPPGLDVMLDRYQSRKKKCPPLNVPEEFLDTDPALLPDRAAYDRVQRWQMSKKGLLLHGVSGTGKSRSAWALLARLWGGGMEVAGYDAQAITDQYEEKRKSGWGPWYTRQLCALPILLIDDLGNEEWGDGLMMHLVKTRAEKGRPTIVSTQHTGDTIYSRAKNRQRVAALIRRLRDHYEPITFRKPKEVQP